MAGIKRKHMDRRGWFTDCERSFACMRVEDGLFRGGIALITFTGLKEPVTVDSPEGPLCIADQGYRWLELVPDCGHFALTAMFRGDELFEQYIDVTLRNEVGSDGNAAFYDLLLDVVVLGDGTPRILDREELEEALSSGSVSRDEYELALRTAERVVACWKENGDLIRRKLYGYRERFSD